MEQFPIIDISDQDIEDIEQMGTKSKFWYTDSNTGEEYLFKSTHTEDGYGRQIVRKGEDWAEKIACEIAEKLGIPHAQYDLAIYNGQRGIRSKKFTSTGENMFFGNQLIEHVVVKINATLETGQRSQTVDRVQVILDRLIQNPPKGWISTDNIKSASDVFMGYLLLDTLVSNQDRHNENWAMIADKDTITLAPSFDHAASLGRNESLEKIRVKLTSKDVGQQIHAYVSRSKSYFYNGNQRLKTLEAFWLFGMSSKTATIEWLSRLEKVEVIDFLNIIKRIPNSVMDDLEKEFCLEILIINRARILRLNNDFEEGEGSLK
ncbi:HipA domain-containing protein [Shewanella sp. HL-SH8]|uniref:HipA domain-containing protein n=1 Tax=Shewanella sp. HL-SH8 TaxID=3436242 RepID=UPI003EB6ECA1